MEPEVQHYVDAILRDGAIISLGISDAEGPWVADLVYVYDDQYTLYWISKPSSRHSMAIANGAKVAGTIHASVETDRERALQIAGTAERVEGRLPDMESLLDKKRGTGPDDSADSMLEDGYSWYKLTPFRIELLQSEPFGYGRQRVL